MLLLHNIEYNQIIMLYWDKYYKEIEWIISSLSKSVLCYNSCQAAHNFLSEQWIDEMRCAVLLILSWLDYMEYSKAVQNATLSYSDKINLF